MAKVSEHFQCPFCGQHAPLERLDEPIGEPQLYEKTLGGKRGFTEDEREATKDIKIKRGGMAGLLDYREIDMPEEVMNKLIERAKQLVKKISQR